MSTKSLAQLLEIAVRKNLTFKSPTGELLPQDLFDLPLTSTKVNAATLDGIALALNAELEAAGGKVVSFVKPTPSKVDYTEVKFDIVKAILDEKIAARDTAAAAAVKAANRQKIMALLEKKNDQDLESMSREDLLKLLDE